MPPLTTRVDFLPDLLLFAGIEDTDRQRELNLVNSGTSMVGALVGSGVVDHIGRRKLMLFAAFACCAGMVIVGGLLSPAGGPEALAGRADAGVAFIFLFMVFYSVGWTPLQALYPAEVLSYENRAKGLALQGLTTNAVSMINTFGMPPAMRTLGWISESISSTRAVLHADSDLVYLIFAAWDVVGIILMWIFVVETKQLTLEEMDQVFDARHPKKRSFELAAEARERAKFEKERRNNQGV